MPPAALPPRCPHPGLPPLAISSFYPPRQALGGVSVLWVIMIKSCFLFFDFQNPIFFLFVACGHYVQFSINYRNKSKSATGFPSCSQPLDRQTSFSFFLLFVCVCGFVDVISSFNQYCLRNRYVPTTVIEVENSNENKKNCIKNKNFLVYHAYFTITIVFLKYVKCGVLFHIFKCELLCFVSYPPE